MHNYPSHGKIKRYKLRALSIKMSEVSMLPDWDQSYTFFILLHSSKQNLKGGVRRTKGKSWAGCCGWQAKVCLYQ